MEESYIIMTLFLLVFTLWLFKRYAIPSILAWIVVGILIGPKVLAWFDYQSIYILADYGIVFLMFSLGLEFSLFKLWKMRKEVTQFGTLQALLTFLFFFVLVLSYGASKEESFIIASAVILSSTAIVMSALLEKGFILHRYGHIAISILLFQDLIVIPILIIIPFLGKDIDQFLLMQEIFYALLKGSFVFSVILIVMNHIFPIIYNEIERYHSDELFVLTTILVACSTAFFTLYIGLSFSLGAFLSGVVLSESQYKNKIEKKIKPFKDLLLGVFFISIGMLLRINIIFDYWYLLILFLFMIMMIKFVLLFLIMFCYKEKNSDAIKTALILSHMGEFSFVVINTAFKWQVISSQLGNLLIAVSIISIILSTFFIKYIDKVDTVLSYFKK